MSSTPRLPQKVTREELFRQVWEKPMIKLGELYGISGNGLAKICDRLSVPYPPRGHWAKKAAGKKVKETTLPPTPEGTPTEVWIRPTELVQKSAEIPRLFKTKPRQSARSWQQHLHQRGFHARTTS